MALFRCTGGSATATERIFTEQTPNNGNSSSYTPTKNEIGIIICQVYSQTASYTLVEDGTDVLTVAGTGNYYQAYHGTYQLKAGKEYHLRYNTSHTYRRNAYLLSVG